jgi:hypothetical protein
LNKGILTVEKNTGIESVSGHQLSLYPNPVTEKLTIQRASNEVLKYTILSSSGMVVLSGSLVDKVATINVSGLNSGEYYIIVDGRKTQESFSFVKQ